MNRFFHGCAPLLVDKSFGGKGHKDKPIKAEAPPKIVKVRTDDVKRALDQERKERELKKKEIKMKQIEIQKKRDELKAVKTEKKNQKKSR